MKRISIFVISALACAAMFLMSCRDGRDTIETMYNGFMTGQTDANGHISVLKDDFGRKYTVKDESDKLKPDTAYRMVASIVIDDDNTARIIQKVPAMSYIAPEDSIVPDTMRVKDPIEIISHYIGGGYLNLHLGILVKNESSEHSLFYTHLDTPGKLKFTVYHNAYGDTQVYTKYAYISIPLSGYGLAKNDTVFLSAKGYKEDYDLKLIYK